MIRKNQKILRVLYVLLDFLTIQFIFLFAWYLKFQSGLLDANLVLTRSDYFQWSLVYSFFAIVIGLMSGLYAPKRKKNFTFEVLKLLQTHIISLFILLSLLFFFKAIHISREFLGVYFTGILLCTTVLRLFIKSLLKWLRQKGYNKQFVLILGAGTVGNRFYDNLKNFPELGYEVVGFLDDNCGRENNNLLGKLDDLGDILNRRTIDEVVIALPLEAHVKFPKIINSCEKAGVRTLIIPDFFDYLPAKPTFENFVGIPIINIRDIPLDEISNQILKRSFDIVFAILAIIVTLPVLVLIAIGIKLTSPGPIIFKQERVGLNRRNFNMYKFRSMKVTSAETSDKVWTTEDDPRRTKFGTFLRKTSLDELPQFFNVLFGHMSVVGPRPERPFFVEQFKEEIPKYMVKHHVRPGITGWAQSNGLRGDTSIEERIRYDIFYIENWSLLFDIKIIWKTIWNGFVNKNAY